MTEQEWLECVDPHAVLGEYTWGTVSDRKYRLFAVACCRRIGHVMTDQRARNLVDVVERLVEGQAGDDEWQQATGGVAQACAEYSSTFAVMFMEQLSSGNYILNEQDSLIHAQHFATSAAWELRHPMATPHISGMHPYERTPNAAEVARWTATAVHPEYENAQDCFWKSSERPKQSALLRDIFGNPFRPVTINPDWRTLTVVSLAQAIYDEHAFDRLPILADALEDAGCDNADILNHCRQPGEHVRGCWAVDLVLGKS